MVLALRFFQSFFLWDGEPSRRRCLKGKIRKTTVITGKDKKDKKLRKQYWFIREKIRIEKVIMKKQRLKIEIFVIILDILYELENLFQRQDVYYPSYPSLSLRICPKEISDR